MVETVTTANYDNEVANSELPVLIDFNADWCGPCKMMGPVVSELSETYAGKVKIASVNVDMEPDLAEKFNVMSIPAFVVVKNGEKVDSAVGAMPKEKLMGMLDKVIG